MTSLTIVALLATASQAAIPTGDKVTSLPDIGTPSSDMYSGYISLNDTKKLHYVFTYS